MCGFHTYVVAFTHARACIHTSVELSTHVPAHTHTAAGPDARPHPHHPQQGQIGVPSGPPAHRDRPGGCVPAHCVGSMSGRTKAERGSGGFKGRWDGRFVGGAGVW
eukprot:27387-Chlamydomonas_euryale.AAC.2